MEAYFKVASIHADDVRLVIAGGVLFGTAQTWWRQELDRHNDPSSVTVESPLITTWLIFSSAFRKRFLPEDPNLWARDKLKELCSKKMANVGEYTAMFDEYLALVVDMDECSKVLLYGDGTPHDLFIKIRAKKFTSYIAVKEFALAQYNAYQAATTSSRGHSSTSGLRTMDGSDAPSTSTVPGEGITAEGLESNSLGSAGTLNLSTEFKLMQAQMVQLTAMFQQSINKSGGGRNSQRDNNNRSRSRSSSKDKKAGRYTADTLPDVPGVSKEVVKARYDKRVCFKCGQDGHGAGTCPNPTKSTN